MAPARVETLSGDWARPAWGCPCERDLWRGVGWRCRPPSVRRSWPRGASARWPCRRRRAGPLVVPVWYDYSPGGEVSFLTGADSRKARAVAKAGRFSMLAERTHPTYRYVSVEGPVSSSNPPRRTN
ncbi:pyridoxamine 5'-phosphate oxidase family protein [Nonomuraea dietziae]|uniref:pyridoxamine 5'-phosphate oxidase family protein n=1 Tax=Nonomuraea dietziae TaxID=65515 RepID=UPI00362392E2